MVKNEQMIAQKKKFEEKIRGNEKMAAVLLIRWKLKCLFGTKKMNMRCHLIRKDFKDGKNIILSKLLVNYIGRFNGNFVSSFLRKICLYDESLTELTMESNLGGKMKMIIMLILIY
jgi:hypothetical protein